MNELKEFLLSAVSVVEIKSMIVMLIAVFASGVMAAVISNIVNLADLKNIWKQAATVTVAYLAICLLAAVLTDWLAVRTAMWLFLMGFMFRNIVKNLENCGVPVPDVVKKYMKIPG